MGHAVTVHDVLRNRARLRGAERWIDELPDRIAALESAWSLRVIGPPFESATEAFVAPAELADGTAVVLKVLLPWPGGPVDHEASVLRVADGNGCVRLLRHDEAHAALLLEALGPPLDQLGLATTRRHEIMCDTLTPFWRGTRGAAELATLGLPSGADKAVWLADRISELAAELDGACTRAAIDHALACADRRRCAHDTGRATLVHGDVHQWNTLRHPDGGFRFVDPDGLFAEAEYDLGILMREDPDEPDDPARDDPRRRSRWLAGRTGLDEEAIWEWGVVERVSTGLAATAIGLQPVGAQMLAVADRVAT
jgi:streptomycin 6-kinase